VIISEDSDGTVRVICEGLGLGPDRMPKVS